MRTLIYLLISISSIYSFAQDHYRLSETGMKFKFFKDEKGPTANIGDFVSLDMIMYSPDGEILRSSYKEGKPVLFPVKLSAFEGDIYEAVSMLSENDSAEFLINADSMYAKVFRKPKPSSISQGGDLKVVIRAYKVRSQVEYQKEQELLYAQHLKETEKLRLQRRKKDDIQIKEYLSDLGVEGYNKTDLGVYIKIIDEGKGKQINDGQAVVFHYKGSLLNGVVFENTFPSNTPFSFTIGQKEVIPGWEDAMKNLKVGSTATVVIPSDLAYADHAKGDAIPVHSILVFEIKILASY